VQKGNKPKHGTHATPLIPSEAIAQRPLDFGGFYHRVHGSPYCKVFAISSLGGFYAKRTLDYLVLTFGGYTEAMAKHKSPDQLIADIDARRERILSTVGDLQSFASPSNIANRSLNKALSFFTNEEGKPRPERIVIAVAGVLGLIGLLSRDDD
jgi:hypothetical protein